MLSQLANTSTRQGLGGFGGPSGGESLDAEMVLLVHHDAERAVFIEHERPTGFAPLEVGGGEAAADKVFALGVGDVAVDGEIQVRFTHRSDDRFENELELFRVGDVREAMFAEVAKQSGPGAEDDVRVRSVSIQPRGLGHRAEHEAFPGFRIARRLRHTTAILLLSSSAFA